MLVFKIQIFISSMQIFNLRANMVNPKIQFSITCYHILYDSLFFIILEFEYNLILQYLQLLFRAIQLYKTNNKSILTIFPLMFNMIRYIFQSFHYDQVQKYEERPSTSQIKQKINKKTQEIMNAFELTQVKVLIRSQTQDPSNFVYIKLQDQTKVNKYLRQNKGTLTISYFHRSKESAMISQVKQMTNQMTKRQKQLKTMINELKDQNSTLFVFQVISKTSKSSVSYIEQFINVFIISSQPLVDMSKKNPRFYPQIDFSQHVQSLKRVSLCQSNLLIQVKCSYAIHEDLILMFNSHQKCMKQINIVQLFTRIVKKDGKLWASLENKIGEEIWVEANEFLSIFHVELLIIIGIGAQYLEELQFKYPLILISTVSLEQSMNVDNQPNGKDEMCRLFLQTLYQKIFQRKQLSQAIQQAKKQAIKKSHNHLWCCCLHQHADQCNWNTIVDTIGHLNAHRLFKHTLQLWTNERYYDITQKLQQFILNNNETCSQHNTCCWNKLKIHKNSLHKNPNKVIIWNNKSYNRSSQITNQNNRLNQFISEVYDKPTIIKRPLYLFMMISNIINHKILILRFNKLDNAIKMIIQAYDYIKLRDKNCFMLQIELNQSINILSMIQSFVINLKKSRQIVQQVKLLVIFIQDQKIKNQYEQFLVKQHNIISQLSEKLQIHLKLHYILINCHPSTQYPIFKQQIEINPRQKCFGIFNKIKSKNLVPQTNYNHELISIQTQLNNHKNYNQIQIYEKCQKIQRQYPLEYDLMGFLSTFGQDGFYLTDFTQKILSKLFNKQILQHAIKQKLSIECIKLTNCYYLQLIKSYNIYFNSLQNKIKQQFILKKLQFHYLTVRLYEQLLPEYLAKNLQGILQCYLKKQGVFSINIQLQDQSYDNIVKQCKRQLFLTKRLQDITFNYHNFKSIFHINQIQKLLELIMNHNKGNPSINLFNFQDKCYKNKFNYLLWNIILKIHIFLNVQQTTFLDKINKFYYVFLLFILKQETDSLISQVAKIQICFILGQHIKKISENVSIEKYKLKYFLFCLKFYTSKISGLLLLKPQWGNAHRFKETLSSCMVFISKIKEFYEQTDSNKDILEIFRSNKMFTKCTVGQWNRQCLRIIQKTVIFYFNFTKMIKSQKMNKNVKQSFDHLKLGEIRYQFNKIVQKMKDSNHNKPVRYLLDHYFKVTLNECKPQRGLLEIIKNKIPLELQPIYNHLRSKIDKGSLFNQKGLVIFARARTSIVDGKPYIFNRKKYFNSEYLKIIIQETNLKTSYFNLTTQIFSYLQNDHPKAKTQILYFILTMDSPNAQYFLIGSQLNIQCVKMSIRQLTTQILKTKIKLLIINGQNSRKASQKIYQYYKQHCETQLNGNNEIPIILALESKKYNMNDNRFNTYKSQDIAENKYGWQYLCQQINQIALNLIILSIISFINHQTINKHFTLKKNYLSKITQQSLSIVKQILQPKYQCTQQVFDNIGWSIYGEKIFLNKVQKGKVEDLTSKFYSHQHNLEPHAYYENIGRCQQIYKILNGLKNSISCIEIYGNSSTGKSNILNQSTWTCLLKNFFKFGVHMLDLNDQSNHNFEQFFQNRKFIDRDQSYHQSSLLIVLDNLNSKIIQKSKISFQKIRGKSITLLYSTSQVNLHEIVADILDIHDILKIDLNKISKNDIYGLLMTHLKHPYFLKQPQQQALQNVVYSKHRIEIFDEKVESIMQYLQKIEEGQKIKIALQLLFNQNEIKVQQKNKQFLNFYKQNYEQLLIILKKQNDLNIRFI